MRPEIRDWLNLAKEWFTRFIRRPFANNLSLIAVTGGFLIIMGRNTAENIINLITTHYFNVPYPVSAIGPWEYSIGITCILSGLIYSGFYHYVSMLTPKAAPKELPIFDLRFLDSEGKEIAESTFERNLITVVDEQNIPDLVGGMFDFSPNHDYWREMYYYWRGIGRAIPVRFCLQNRGTVSGRRIVARIEVTSTGALEEMDDRPPSKPSKDTLGRIRQVWLPTDVQTEDCKGSFTLDILNPGDQYVTSDPVWLHPLNSGDITLTVKIFSEDMPEPFETIKVLKVHVEHLELAASEFVQRVKMQREAVED